MNRRILIGAAAPILALALGSGVAWGSAANKTNAKANRTYDSQADSSAGIDLLGGVGGPTLVQVAESEGSSDTSGGGGSGSSTGESSANALNVADVVVIGEAECASAGVDGEGAQKSEGSDALIDESGEGYDVGVLTASCSSRSVQSNTSSTTAESAVLDASLDGVGSVTVLSSSSETSTTSGQSRSSSSLTVVHVAGADGEEIVDVSCQESASANRGQTTESDDGCGPLAAATASHTSG